MGEELRLPRSTPESQGVSSRALLDFVSELDKLEYLHSFMLMRHGRVIAECWRKPYRRELKHNLFSLSKSFTSLAAGMALEEGLFRLDDTVAGLMPEKIPSGIRDDRRRITVRHLLTMTTGHDRCVLNYLAGKQVSDWVRGFFTVPVVYGPGTHFTYNSGASFILSALVQKFSGQSLSRYLEPRLFTPLGITGFRWEKNPQNIDTGGWGLYLKTEDTAKFAELLRCHGRWRGRQLVPASYLRNATMMQVSTHTHTVTSPDWQCGYGYHFWCSQHGAFRGDGTGGQMALVMPRQNMTLVTTGGTGNMQNILNAVWETLLPALHDTPLPDCQAYSNLQEVLNSWEIPALQDTIFRRADNASYRIINANLPQISHIHTAFDDRKCSIAFDTPSGRETLHAGFGFNCEGEIKLNMPAKMKYAASAAWAADDLLNIQVCCTENPYLIRFAIHCTPEGIRVSRKSNCLLQNPDWEELCGITEPIGY